MEILFGRPSVKKYDVRHAKIILTSVVDIHDGKMLKDVRHEKNIPSWKKHFDVRHGKTICTSVTNELYRHLS